MSGYLEGFINSNIFIGRDFLIRYVFAEAIRSTLLYDMPIFKGSKIVLNRIGALYNRNIDGMINCYLHAYKTAGEPVKS